METLWEEFRRYLTDSVRELNRLIEQVQRLADSQSSLQSADAKLGGLKSKLNHTHSLLMNVPTIEERDPAKCCASAGNEGEFWTIGWDRKTVRVKSAKGVRLLAVLIDNPGRQFHVMDLERYERMDDPDGADPLLVSSDAGPMLDDSAKRSYRARLRDLREELEEAQRFNDLFRASKIRDEMAILTKELTRAFGLRGDSRRALSDAERARVRVTLAVKSAVEKISRYDPSLGWHLLTTVKTGSFCLYLPSPVGNNGDGFQGTDI